MYRILKQVSVMLAIILLIGVANVVTTGRALDYDDPLHEDQLEAAGTADWTSVTINGTGLPLTGYGYGEYYTRNGHACNSHPGTFCSNCILYTASDNSAGRQCLGFAMYVYEQIWGSITFGHYEEYPEDRYRSVNTAKSAKSFFQNNIEPGALIRVKTSSGNFHAFIVVEVASTYVRIYDANSTDICNVSMRRYSYGDIATSYPEIWWYRTPGHHDSLSYNSTYHYICTNVDCAQYHVLQQYAHDGVAGTYGTCNTCGYVGIINIGTSSVEPEDE